MPPPSWQPPPAPGPDGPVLALGWARGEGPAVVSPRHRPRLHGGAQGASWRQLPPLPPESTLWSLPLGSQAWATAEGVWRGHGEAVPVSAAAPAPSRPCLVSGGGHRWRGAGCDGPGTVSARETPAGWQGLGWAARWTGRWRSVLRAVGPWLCPCWLGGRLRPTALPPTVAAPSWSLAAPGLPCPDGCDPGARRWARRFLRAGSRPLGCGVEGGVA